MPRTDDIVVSVFGVGQRQIIVLRVVSFRSLGRSMCIGIDAVKGRTSNGNGSRNERKGKDECRYVCTHSINSKGISADL